MAFSKALIKIVLSMPFSLLTCSITRFRSCCMLGAPIVLVIRLFDYGKRNLDPCTVLNKGDAVDAHGFEWSQKRSPAVNHLSSPNPDPLADEPIEMLRSLEGPVNTGRRYFQRVGAFYCGLGIEDFAQLSAHSAQ